MDGFGMSNMTGQDGCSNSKMIKGKQGKWEWGVGAWGIKGLTPQSYRTPSGARPPLSCILQGTT